MQYRFFSAPIMEVVVVDLYVLCSGGAWTYRWVRSEVRKNKTRKI